MKSSLTSILLGLVALSGSVSLAMPQAQAQREVVAMGVPRLGATRLGSVAPTNLYHGSKNRSKNSAKFSTRSSDKRAAKIQRGAYTKLEWVKTKEAAAAAAAAAAAKKSVKNIPVAKPVHAGVPFAASSTRTIGPGVIYKVYAGKTRINLIDVNMSVSPLMVRPVPASSTFHGLKDVHDHVRDSGAIAAINANYFKGNGTPLGTLMLDGEWLSGPLYSRVALGFTDGGYARIARVGLHGILHTSIAGNESLWINNVNQPRSSGSHCVLYTRRWGERVSLPYDGTLIAVDGSGEVIDRHPRSIAIPYGGFVLADSKKSAVAVLSRGDKVNVTWSITPKEWHDVTQAVSGGPLLLKNGKIAFDLKGEKFPASWTGSKITRRTACGITNDDHLLMATFEGPHTLYDVAKFFQRNNCSEALNLDGGGSTTMVVNGTTVTRNATDSQRRVAVALGLFSEEKAKNMAANSQFSGYRPHDDISSLIQPNRVASQSVQEAGAQLSELTPVATKNLPEVAVSAISEKVANAPYVAPVEVDAQVSDSSNHSGAGSSSNSFTVGQVEAPVAGAENAAIKSVVKSSAPSINKESASVKAKTDEPKSGKLKPDFGKRLIKGLFGR